MKEKQTEYLVTRLLIVFGILVFGYFGARIVASLYFDRLMSDYAKSLQNFTEYYQTKVNLETDPYKLTRLGRSLLKANQNDLAYSALKKSTELDPKWRDGWVWRGYGELKLSKPKDALASLKNAEKIDSIFPFTYELLSIAYQATGDETSAQFAQEKNAYLEKSYQ